MNFLFEILRLGLHNLWLHKLRSVLTSLGIIFGVAAVIVMVSIGEGSKQAALRDIQALGANNVIVRSVKPPESGDFSQEVTRMASYGILRQDLRRLQAGLPDVAHIVPLKSVGDEVSHGAKRMTSQAFGTLPELRDVTSIDVQPGGRYITDEDVRRRAPVAVIGSEVARQLFKLQYPIGQSIRIGQQVVTVVGVLRPVGLAGGAGSALVGRDLNLDVHIPLSTAELLFSDVFVRGSSGSFNIEQVELHEIYITAHTTDDVEDLSALVTRTLEVGHDEMRDVQVIVPWELLEQKKRETAVWNLVLISIAAISLLIGGIGIMNIMLASVTERTREIGIRRALGATRQHIVAQFLVETGSLSWVGGLLGIAFGVGASIGLERGLPLLLELPIVQRFFDTNVRVETVITAWSIFASFLVAALVGLGFGIYPAVVASRQDPIVALRHD